MKFTNNTIHRCKDTKHRVVNFPEPVRVPNNLTMRHDVKIRLTGYERSISPNTTRWLSLMHVEWKREGFNDWSKSTDIIIAMTYADHYYFLHDMPTNYNYEYGKQGRRKPVYSQRTVKRLIHTKRLTVK